MPAPTDARRELYARQQLCKGTCQDYVDLMWALHYPSHPKRVKPVLFRWQRAQDGNVTHVRRIS